MLKLNDPSLLRTAVLIDGQWTAAANGKTIDVTNPATGDVVATVPNGGTLEAERAIASSARAFQSWRQTTAEQRAKVLRRWFELMNEHQEDLAAIMTAEQGKPLAEARGEIAYAAAYIEWFAEEARRVYGDIVPSPWGDKNILVKKEPVGVC